MPDRPILLSVVIPTWNAAELTATTLEGLVRGGVPVWGEIIVVDDGSDDGTAGKLSQQFPHIRVLRHESNRGFGAAVNTGFSSATGRYLGTVNNDVSVTWTCLERLVEFLEGQADGGAAAPVIVDGPGVCRRVGFDFPRTPWQLVARRLSRRIAGGQRSLAASVAPYASEYLRGACVVFRRAALEAVGLFDEQYHMFAEEIDLFRRLSRGGWTAWVLPSERATHYEGQTSRNHPDPVTASKFRQQSYRSICIYYSKQPFLVHGVTPSRDVGGTDRSETREVARAGVRPRWRRAVAGRTLRCTRQCHRPLPESTEGAVAPHRAWVKVSASLGGWVQAPNQESDDTPQHLSGASKRADFGWHSSHRVPSRDRYLRDDQAKLCGAGA